MLNLDQHNPNDINRFYDELVTNGLLEKLTLNVSKSKLPAKIKVFLDKSRIKEILEASPEKLMEIHEKFIITVNKTYSVADYELYLATRYEKNTTAIEKKLIRAFHPITKKLYKIFDYDYYISKKKEKSYPLAKLIGRNTCTYCNRLYTFTIGNFDPKTGKIEKSDTIARPQFDHWFPKKKYPLFALSFYNLIPSCSVCNSSVKGDEPFYLDKHIHPYITETDQKFRFSYSKKADGSNEVTIKCHGDKVKKTLEDLKIREIYNEHSNYELQELLDLRYKYSDNYLNLLFNKTFNLSEVSKKDAYRMLFGVEIDPKDFHKRPFSKFKYDILQELGIIKK